MDIHSTQHHSIKCVVCIDEVLLLILIAILAFANKIRTKNNDTNKQWQEPSVRVQFSSCPPPAQTIAHLFFREKGMKKWHRPSKKEKKKKDENTTKISAYKRQLGICCEHFIMYSGVCLCVCHAQPHKRINSNTTIEHAIHIFLISQIHSIEFCLINKQKLLRFLIAIAEKNAKKM